MAMKVARVILSWSALSLAILAGASESAAQSGGYAQAQLNRLNSGSKSSNFTSAAINRSVISRAIPTYAYSTANRGLLNAATGSGSGPTKPFTSYQRSSGVSPYLGLVGSNPYVSTTDNYFKIVRPQMEQQKQNERLMQQNIAMQKQLGSIASQAPYNPQGAADRAPTGHTSVYFNYGGYYNPVKPQSIRGRR
jgi:hypothetical protein